MSPVVMLMIVYSLGGAFLAFMGFRALKKENAERERKKKSAGEKRA
jgi:threonine/homoserine/homoserine lactone efflux protein